MKTLELQQHLEGYLELRAAVGYTVRSDRSLLRGFVMFLERLETTVSRITADVALTWACSSAAAGTAARAQRLSKVRGFLTYLRVFWPETDVPGPGLLPRSVRRAPYIYSDEDIAKILGATRLLGERGFAHRADPSKCLLPDTYTTLIGLLVSTGLRVGEAIRLDLDDLRLGDATPHLVVRRTKFRKSRVVPLHPTVAERLHGYVLQRRELGYDGFTPAVLVSERGRRLNHDSVWRTWGILLRRSGLQRTVDGRRPTIHALRHAFAVRRLVEWQREGADVGAMVPHLSVYMGHAEPKNTYWYLSATPELLSPAAHTFERYATGGAQ